MALIIVPSIDLRAGRVVRLKQGDYARQVNYDVDAAATARSFVETGAEWMHVVDLDGAKEGRPMQTELIATLIAGSGLKVQAGGGIRSTEDIQKLLDAGASRVVVGTRAMEDWEWFQTTIALPAFSGRIVLALDAKDGWVATRGWTHTSEKRATDVAREVSDWPLAGILYTDVAKDGMLAGPNFVETQKMAQAGKRDVIASGGVGELAHVRALAGLGVWGVIVGRSLYEGGLDLREALAVGKGE